MVKNSGWKGKISTNNGITCIEYSMRLGASIYSNMLPLQFSVVPWCACAYTQETPVNAMWIECHINKVGFSPRITSWMHVFIVLSCYMSKYWNGPTEMPKCSVYIRDRVSIGTCHVLAHEMWYGWTNVVSRVEQNHNTHIHTFAHAHTLIHLAINGEFSWRKSVFGRYLRSECSNMFQSIVRIPATSLNTEHRDDSDIEHLPSYDSPEMCLKWSREDPRSNIRKIKSNRRCE